MPLISCSIYDRIIFGNLGISIHRSKNSGKIIRGIEVLVSAAMILIISYVLYLRYHTDEVGGRHISYDPWGVCMPED